MAAGCSWSSELRHTEYNMIEKQITAANADKQIKQLYETAFPKDEQIPWDDLMRLVEEMPLDFTAYYDGEVYWLYHRLSTKVLQLVLVLCRP